VNADLDARLAAAGRQPGDLERTAFVFCELSGDRAKEDQLVGHFQRTRGGTDEEVRSRVLIGDPDAMVAVLRSYEAAGVGMAILNVQSPFDIAGLERFARDVLPAVA
jgi:alkanesulfonate monooxygenase SsuD/methylene tetrahydromethanopterin reductase-like flavin-dependent oxidoreductase (luciferase family)